MTKIVKTLLIIILLSLTPSLVQAQDNPITATVDRANLSTDEVLMLTVTVAADAATVPQPTMPSLEGFDVLGQSTSTQMSIVNGAVSSQVVYRYRLHPYQTGQLIIDPISLPLGGQVYRTNPIAVQVTQGTGQSAAPNDNAPVDPAQQDFFVEAAVDNETPYLGQQIIYSLRFFQAETPFGQPQYQLPAFNNFWIEEQPDLNRYTERRSGRVFHVVELQTILFPTKAETITIDPTTLYVPGGFFRRDLHLATEPVTVTVQPLPDGAPPGFAGAVGQFTLQSSLDPDLSRVNEPVTLRVVVSGRGNLNTLPDLTWPDMPGWRTFDADTKTESHFEQGYLTGDRVYERLLVPENAGEYTIPAIEYVYFDPETARYQVLIGDPLSLSVVPGDPADSPPPPVLAGVQKEAVELLATDIRHLKPAPTSLRLERPPLVARSTYWLAWLLPVVALIAHLGWRGQRIYRQEHAADLRRSQAHKKARRALERMQKDRQNIYPAAEQVLHTYISAKLNQPVQGLTYTALGQRLAEAGLTIGQVRQVQQCLADIEVGRFAPEMVTSPHADRLLKQLGKLLDELEQALP